MYGFWLSDLSYFSRPALAMQQLLITLNNTIVNRLVPPIRYQIPQDSVLLFLWTLIIIVIPLGLEEKEYSYCPEIKVFFRS